MSRRNKESAQTPAGRVEATVYAPRTYRQLVRSALIPARITVQETDLSIYADARVDAQARDTVILQRGYLENYIRANPAFVQALHPWPEDPLAPRIVQKMIAAGQQAGVGPMAAVAGAVAEQVGLELLRCANEIIVENGGDIFIRSLRAVTVGIYAGASSLSLKIGLKLEGGPAPKAVCTSSATVGHSLSFGRADAVCVLSPSCTLADAAATAICNRIEKPAHLQAAIDWGRRISGVEGILAIVEEKIGLWGSIQAISL